MFFSRGVKWPSQDPKDTKKILITSRGITLIHCLTSNRVACIRGRLLIEDLRKHTNIWSQSQANEFRSHLELCLDLNCRQTTEIFTCKKHIQFIDNSVWLMEFQSLGVWSHSQNIIA